MDTLYFLKQSAHEDLEIRYSLRSVVRHAPWVRRIIVFGDRPAFLADDPAGRVLHIPHEEIAWIGPYRTPTTNFFLTLFLASLLPELDEEFLLFSDDFVLLRDLSIDEARRVRYLEDLAQIKTRGRGLWKESLWRTHDTLARKGYGSLNFETHTPAYLRKRWVQDAYRDLKDFVTEDRFYGLLGRTAVLNYARRQHNFPVINLHEEGSRAGFYGSPAPYAEIVEKSQGRLFLNYDDPAECRCQTGPLSGYIFASSRMGCAHQLFHGW